MYPYHKIKFFWEYPSWAMFGSTVTVAIADYLNAFKAISFCEFFFPCLKDQFYFMERLVARKRKVLICFQPRYLIMDLKYLTHRERGLSLSCFLKCFVLINCPYI